MSRKRAKSFAKEAAPAQKQEAPLSPLSLAIKSGNPEVLRLALQQAENDPFQRAFRNSGPITALREAFNVHYYNSHLLADLVIAAMIAGPAKKPAGEVADFLEGECVVNHNDHSGYGMFVSGNIKPIFEIDAEAKAAALLSVPVQAPREESDPTYLYI